MSVLRAVLLASILAACSQSVTAPPDAGAETDSGPSDVADCNPRAVSCDAPEPECPPGFAASVRDGCWDVCVQNIACAPLTCTDTPGQCPTGWGCAAGSCAPPR